MAIVSRGQRFIVGTVLAVIVGATPALADVKAGVDAWGRGDYAQAVAEWRTAAVAGDADAQFDLGQAYKLGRGVDVDLGTAEQWYAKAAAQGHPQAEDNYGLTLFQNGKRDEAVRWLEKSVARGEPRAELVLGVMLFNGDVVTKDWVRAYALMVRSSAAGLPEGSKTLAQMDNFVPSDVRQQGMTLAQQYQAKNGRPAAVAASPAVVSDQPSAAAPKPTRRTSAVHPLPSGNGWRFQVGAFGDQANARRLWDQLHSQVGAVAELQPFYVRTGSLTKLQVGPVASVADVERVCGDVRSRVPGTPCIAVAP